jgi:hypothetical protein
MNKARTSSSEGADPGTLGRGRKNMAGKGCSLSARNCRNSPRYEIVAGLGVHTPYDGTVENTLASWVKDRIQKKLLYVADQKVIFGKRLRLHHGDTGVPEVEFRPTTIVSGDLDKLYEPRPNVDFDLEEGIMNMLKSLARRLAKDLGEADAELSYGNLKCSLRS